MKLYDGIDPESPGPTLAAGLYGLESRTGLRLTIHDCRGMLYYPDGRPFFPGRYIHSHPYCYTGRFECENWNRRCHEECMLQAEALANRTKRPFCHNCWKGVTELIVPIEHDGSLAMLIYAGVFRTPEAEIPESVPEEQRKLLDAMPEPDDVLFRQLIPELLLFGHGMRYYLDLYCDRSGRPAERHVQIRRFLEDHAHEAVKLADLADWLNLSTNHTCHLVKYHFGKPFHALLLEERLARARRLLENTDLPQKAVAAAAGFPNEFYFNRLFRRENGMPPGEYRRRFKKEETR